jgi:transposase-like protein
MDAKTWKHHLKAQQSSGETITAYCSRHNLALAAFYKWRSLARRQSITLSRNSPKQSKPKFKEIILPPASVRKNLASEYRITVTESDFTLTIPSGFQTEEVKALLSIMSARAAGC